ncbi:hypothetical protein KR222_008900 [Zaprionus bogoriensis]|nr:hypothetical protein KR222_008900 [Zaprionus bogoriensis]
MASSESVFIAAFVHLTLRYSMHISTEEQFHTPGPGLPTAIVCVTMLLIIHHNRIMPNRYQDISIAFKCLLESFVAFCLLELCMLFWASIEYSVYLIASGTLLGLDVLSRKTYFQHENLIIGSFTLPLSLTILAITLQVNEHSIIRHLTF